MITIRDERKTSTAQSGAEGRERDDNEWGRREDERRGRGMGESERRGRGEESEEEEE